MIMSILSIKVLLISTGLIFSLAMGIIFSVHEIPVIWCAIVSLLKPLYLHVITNAIIISVVASARFRRTRSEPPSEHLITVKTPPQSYYGSLSISSTVVEESTAADESQDVGSSFVTETEKVLDEAKYVIIDSMPAHSSPSSREIISPELQMEFLSPSMEKPVLSPRLRRGKLIKTSPPQGAKTLRESKPKPKRQETLDSIWKMITEGHHAPLITEHEPTSETLEGRNNYDLERCRALREQSPTDQKELNHRVEAFVKKFYDEMRFQRQESLKSSYKEILKRA